MTSSWMLVAGFLFATMGVFVKIGAAQFGSAELAFYRSLVSFVAILGVVRMRKGTVRTPFLGREGLTCREVFPFRHGRRVD